MNIGIIIQARMGSTRLPGKILLPFYQGKALLSVLLERMHEIVGIKVIVATSVNPNNDELENYLLSQSEIVYRGSENDVLDRFIKAAELNGVDGIIRICSDNPFLDIEGIAQLVSKAQQSDADYIGFRVNDTPSILTHFGFWGEFVRLSALKHVAETTPTNTPAHEHVTIHIYRNPDNYKCEWIDCPSYLTERNDIRLTIDTPDDMELAKQIYADLKQINEHFTLKDVVDYLNENPDITRSMKCIITNNEKKY